VFPQGTNLTINNCSFLGVTLLNSVVSGGYVYVATAPNEIHITSSLFTFATVLNKKKKERKKKLIYY
jgi:hypothetical protein